MSKWNRYRPDDPHWFVSKWTSKPWRWKTACDAYLTYLFLLKLPSHPKFAGDDRREVQRQFLRNSLLPKSRRTVAGRCLVDMLNGMGFDVEAFISQKP